MTLVEELLTEKVDEVFLECQNRRKINSGDIDPLDAILLETKVRTLAEHITNVLDKQTPSFNMTKTLEVLEDFHCFKRGEIIYATEQTEEHYVVERDIVLVYVPIEKCREVD